MLTNIDTIIYLWKKNSKPLQNGFEDWYVFVPNPAMDSKAMPDHHFIVPLKGWASNAFLPVSLNYVIDIVGPWKEIICVLDGTGGF